MKTKRLPLRFMVAAALALCSAPGLADMIYLSGKIGELPVNARMTQKGEALDGWYFYRSRGQGIHLKGRIEKDGQFRMQEIDPATNKPTGLFEGKAAAGIWTGAWRKADGAPALPLQLRENHDQLKTMSGRFECNLSERDVKSHYIFRWRLKLAITGGVVKSLESTQSANGGDRGDQQCSIRLDDLTQVPTDVGILLKATDEENGDGSKCTVRIVADPDTLTISHGEWGDLQNDCRRSGTTMFCSTRGDWSDIVMERSTQKCKTIK